MYEIITSFKYSTARDKTYEGRGIKTGRSMFDSIAADVRKFKIAKREVRVLEQTTADQNLSMEITHHFRRMSTITYEANDFFA